MPIPLRLSKFFSQRMRLLCVLPPSGTPHSQLMHSVQSMLGDPTPVVCKQLSARRAPLEFRVFLHFPSLLPPQAEFHSLPAYMRSPFPNTQSDLILQWSIRSVGR